MTNRFAVAGVTALLVCSAAHSEEAPLAALPFGEIDIDFRYRFEYVTNGLPVKDAYASTLLSRFVFASSSWKNLSIDLNVDNVLNIGNDLYNSTRNGKTNRAVVPDPDGTDLNIARVNFDGIKNTRLSIGRQRIVLDDARFIGNRPWRQNEQTYDAARAQYDDGLIQADYSFSNQVNRPNGPSSGNPLARLTGRVHALSAGTSAAAPVQLRLGYYNLDFGDRPALSQETASISLGWAAQSGPLRPELFGRYAYQTNSDSRLGSYSSNYLQFTFGLHFTEELFLRLDHARLGAADPIGLPFSTPLANLHRYQGWAAVFSATPFFGVVDSNVQLDWNKNTWTTTLRYHVFESEKGSSRYGNEIDAAVGKEITDGVDVTFTAAHYGAKNFFEDTTRLWLTVAVDLGPALR